MQRRRWMNIKRGRSCYDSTRTKQLLQRSYSLWHKFLVIATSSKGTFDSDATTDCGSSFARRTTPAPRSNLATRSYHLTSINETEAGLWLYFVASHKRVTFSEYVETIPRRVRFADTDEVIPAPCQVTFASFDQVVTYRSDKPYTAQVENVRNNIEISFNNDSPPNFVSSSSSRHRETRSGSEY
jgi:hypothetical protein